MSQVFTTSIPNIFVYQERQENGPRGLSQVPGFAQVDLVFRRFQTTQVLTYGGVSTYDGALLTLLLLFSPGQVTDGVAMSLALHQIDANHFSQGWLAKIKNDVPSDNKHLKANNLRKIIAAIVEFNESVVHFVKLPDFPLPNVNAAAEGQREEIGISFLLF